MTKTPTGQRTHEDEIGQSIRRRGLLAAAWAAMAAFVLKQTTQPVQASTALLVANSETAGVSNNVVGPSTIASTGSYTSTSAILIADAHGTTLPAAPAAIHGSATTPAASSQVCGVYGQGGVFTGVYGTSDNANGLRGEIPGTSNANAIAIYGLNNSSYAGPSAGAGGFGVYGLCAKGHGLVGATSTAGGAAVVGATNGVAGAYAAAFYGPVVVSGNFTVVAGAKSAAVPHPDGTHRRLYCVESPESWFEDFGKGQLECGRADIKIDQDFAAVADLSDYHIFVTARDDQQLLSVTNQAADGFTVQANAAVAALMGKKDTDLNGTFSWRVVAKRKDIKGERLELVTIPAEPTLPSLTEVPVATERTPRPGN